MLSIMNVLLGAIEFVQGRIRFFQTQCLWLERKSYLNEPTSRTVSVVYELVDVTVIQ